MRITFLLFFLSSIAIAQNPNDCTNAILLCGDTDLGINPSGVGFNEFSQPGNPMPTCFNFQADQSWFRIEIETTGTFSFVLSPDVANADYDFAVFGPTTDCSNLGPAIRCFSTNPQAAGVSGDTGLNDTENDTVEGPGAAGNGFLRELDVQAGETYYIIVGLAVGAGGFTMSTSGSADLPPSPTANTPSDIEICDSDGPEDGFTSFDFSATEAEVLAVQSSVAVTFYESLNDANIGQNEITSPYTNTSDPQTIFVRAERTDSNCLDFTEFEISVQEGTSDTELDTRFVCSTAASANFDFRSIEAGLVSDSSAVNISYHNSQMDALDGVNAISPVVSVTSTLREIFIRVEDRAGMECDFVITAPIVLASPPVVNTPTDVSFCDEGNDGLEEIDLNDFNSQILSGLNAADFTVDYYRSTGDRTSGANPLPTMIDGSAPNQLLFARITDNASGCFTDLDFSFIINPVPDLAEQEPQVLCTNLTDPVTLTVEPGFADYNWSNGDSGPGISSITVNMPGIYTVEVTNTLGCTSILELEVIPSEPATIDDIQIQDFNFNNNSVTVIVSGEGDYEFKIGDIGFQNLTVRDKNGCGSVEQTFVILDYQEFFTPNGDGFNDRWTLEGLNEFPQAVVKIFNRNGMFLKQISPEGAGWDGTFANQPLPSSTYWFTLELPNRPVVRGYFALKR
jgi:gliding motility-associated-like protein